MVLHSGFQHRSELHQRGPSMMRRMPLVSSHLHLPPLQYLVAGWQMLAAATGTASLPQQPPLCKAAKLGGSVASRQEFLEIISLCIHVITLHV